MPLLALDDRDADIVYSTGWGQAGGSNEFNSTTTFSRTVGATAEVTFFGTSITVFGTVAGGLLQRPTSSFSIDGGTPVTFTGSPSISVQYNQVFFRSPTLPLANHTLVITNTGDDASTFLDLMLVTPPDAPLTTTTTVTTTLTPATVTSAAQTVTVTSTAQGAASTGNSDNASASNASSGSNSNAGAIAGGIIGGIALLALIVLGALFFIRRQRERRGDADNIAAFWNTTHPGSKPLPSPPLAPQFQSYPGQPPMVQTNNTGGGYSTNGTYEPWQYPNNQTSAPTPVQQPQSYAPPQQAPASAYGRPPSTTDLAYYSTNDAYGGYADPGPYPPPPPAQVAGGAGTNGRVRVNLD